jgi:outer membrane protein assembly factor BamB
LRRSGRLAAVVLVLTWAACSGGDDGSDTTRSGTPDGSDDNTATTSEDDTTTTAPEHDPPLELANESVNVGGLVRNGVYAVHDGVAYFVEGVDDALVAVDLATGEPVWSEPVESDFLGFWGSPEVAEVDGQALVFATYGTVEEGTGTEADQEMLRIVALDAADATPVWTTDVPAADIPEAAREDVLGSSVSDVSPARAVAADGDHVVVSTDEGYRDAFTVVLDAASGDPMWNAGDFQALALGGAVVAGITEHPDSSLPDTGQLAARSIADGSPVWQAEDVFVPDGRTISSLGPERLSAGGDVYSSGAIHADSEATHVFASGDGTVVTTLDGRHTCVDDGEDTIVCDSGEHVVALDRESGETLWELPDEAAGRIAPTVTAARSGAVYTDTDNGPVILDARTGEDRVTDLTVAPDDVVPGFGLVVEDDSFGDDVELLAYPATG